jgi:hypothetical protein
MAGTSPAMTDQFALNPKSKSGPQGPPFSYTVSPGCPGGAETPPGLDGYFLAFFFDLAFFAFFAFFAFLAIVSSLS